MTPPEALAGNTTFIKFKLSDGSAISKASSETGVTSETENQYFATLVVKPLDLVEEEVEPGTEVEAEAEVEEKTENETTDSAGGTKSSITVTES